MFLNNIKRQQDNCQIKTQMKDNKSRVQQSKSHDQVSLQLLRRDYEKFMAQSSSKKYYICKFNQSESLKNKNSSEDPTKNSLLTNLSYDKDSHAYWHPSHSFEKLRKKVVSQQQLNQTLANVNENHKKTIAKLVEEREKTEKDFQICKKKLQVAEFVIKSLKQQVDQHSKTVESIFTLYETMQNYQ